MRFQSSPVHLRVTSTRNIRVGKRITEVPVHHKFASVAALDTHMRGKSDTYLREASVEILVHGVPVTGCVLKEVQRIGVSGLILNDLTGSDWTTAVNWVLAQ